MLPGVDANVPAMQGVQGSLPVSLKDPAGHRSAAATVAKRPEAKMTAAKSDARMGVDRPIREVPDQGVFTFASRARSRSPEPQAARSSTHWMLFVEARPAARMSATLPLERTDDGGPPLPDTPMAGRPPEAYPLLPSLGGYVARAPLTRPASDG